MPDSDQSAIIYDNTCSLCNHAVRFLRTGKDRNKMIFFGTDNSQADQLLKLHQIPRELTDKTVILICNGKTYTKSTAIIRALQQKGGGWKLAAVLRIIPVFIRDALYDFVARRR
jgi:predicted DCC family thiol-disulfide oxidoreductase YuxK